MTGQPPRLNHDTLRARRAQAVRAGRKPDERQGGRYSGPMHPCATDKCGHPGFWHVFADKPGCSFAPRETDRFGKAYLGVPCECQEYRPA